MYLPLTLRFPFQYTMITNLLKKNNQWTNFYYQEFNFVILIPVTNLIQFVGINFLQQSLSKWFVIIYKFMK